MRTPLSRDEHKVRAEMEKLHIREKDLEERFVLSPGRGGQNVNKVATCVCLFHRPSGIRVRCHRERSQKANRILARMILVGKIRDRQRRVREERSRQKNKERRQRQARPARVKAAMREAKKRHSLKKEWRRGSRVRDWSRE